MSSDDATRAALPEAAAHVFDAMGTARAMRWLKPDPVPRELVDQVLWGATRATNPRNSQPWDFVVVQDRKLRSTIGEIVAGIEPTQPVSEDPDPVVRRTVEGGMNLVANFAEAPVIIFVCGREFPYGHAVKLNYAYSATYAAAQNLIVSARALGLGTTFTTFHDRNEPAIRTILGIPDDRFIAVTMPLGWPAREFGPLQRRPLHEVVHYDTW